MAARVERKAQVETQAKMIACVDSIRLVFEINVRTARSEETEPEAERTDLVRRTSVGQQESKQPTHPACEEKACAETHLPARLRKTPR